MQPAQYLIDRHGAATDPYMTLVDYFTSLRELAGMRRLVEDDIADRLTSQQVRTCRRLPMISQLISRMPSSRIAATLAELEWRFDPAFDSSVALEEFRRYRAAAKERGEDRLQPLVVLLATSTLQVGVDVQRLGLMAVTGQPKNTAEYIQATSRIGRDRQRPGLVRHHLPVDPAPRPGAPGVVRLRPCHVRAADRGPDYYPVQRPGTGPGADRGAGHCHAALRHGRTGQRRREHAGPGRPRR